MVDERICKLCGKVFTVPYKSIKREYCSHRCANKASGAARQRRTIFTCENCGKTFEVVNSSVVVREKKHKIRFCSHQCTGESIRTGKTEKCLCCGNEFYTTRNKFCSRECVGKYKRAANGIGGSWYESGYVVLYNGGDHIKEHIKVMEDSLGRKLELWEVVHHKNGIRDDNRLENLQLMSRGEHSAFHRKQEVKNGKILFSHRYPEIDFREIVVERKGKRA